MAVAAIIYLLEETKHLKIETATHLFSKFTCMQEMMFDLCMSSYFLHRRRWGHPTAWLGVWVSASAWTRS
jgi:hypothetical protein